MATNLATLHNSEPVTPCRPSPVVLMDYLSERQSELLEQMHRQRRHAA